MSETNFEAVERNIKEFVKIQKYMLIAKKENATETYSELKDEYITLKAILNTAGINLTELDKIKE